MVNHDVFARAHNIDVLYKDIYSFRGRKLDSYDYVLDIGGCYGAFSIMSVYFNINAKVFCFEPNPSIYQELLKRTYIYHNIKCFNFALGDGGDMLFDDSPSPGMHCLDPDGKLSVKSLKFLDLVKLCNIDFSKRVLLKCDCEGGERYLLNDECVEVLRRCCSLEFEVHFVPARKPAKFYNSIPWEVYDSFFRKNFSDYNIVYHHSRKRTGLGTYSLNRK